MFVTWALNTALRREKKLNNNKIAGKPSLSAIFINIKYKLILKGMQCMLRFNQLRNIKMATIHGEVEVDSEGLVKGLTDEQEKTFKDIPGFEYEEAQKKAPVSKEEPKKVEPKKEVAKKTTRRTTTKKTEEASK